MMKINLTEKKDERVLNKFLKFIMIQKMEWNLYITVKNNYKWKQYWPLKN